MGMVVTWDVDFSAVKYRVYRDTKAFTPATLPTDVTEIPYDAVTIVHGKCQLEYEDAVRQTVYHLMFCVEDADGNTSYSERMVMGYFPESGPGPTELLRGTWEFGYFGEVAATELPSYQDMINALLSAGAVGRTWTSTNPTAWNKCIVNGRIIFIPTTPLEIATSFSSGGTTTAQAAYKATLLDGTVQLRNRDNEFSIRLPSMHTDHTSFVSMSIPDFKVPEVINSEMAMVVGLMAVPTPTTSLTPTPGALPDINLSLGDYPATTVIGNVYTSATAYCIYNTNGVFAGTSISSTTSYKPILELLF